MSSEPQEGSVREQHSAAEGTVPSLQSLRELISERLAAAAEEIFRLCEGTIVQYEEELCRQRRLLDSRWNPQLQLHVAVLPQNYASEEDLSNQQRNLRVEHEEPEPPYIKDEHEEPEPAHIKQEQEEQEPTQIKEEKLQEEPKALMTTEGQEGFYISQDEDQRDLKQETDTLIEIPTYEEDENLEADRNNQLSFNATDSQDEEGNQHEESTSTTDEETDPQNRDKRKRRDRRHVQSADSSHMSAGQCDSDVGKKSKKAALVKKRKQSPKEKIISSLKSGENSRVVGPHVDKDITEPVERLFICKECNKDFRKLSYLKEHMRNHAKERPFSCEECDKSYCRLCDLKKHMRTHTGEKPYSCKECDKSFKDRSHLRGHMKTHTGEKPFSCECNKSFVRRSDLKRHMRTHTGEKLFSCKECDKGFCQTSDLKRHLRTHTGEKPYSCKECNKSFRQISTLKRHEILYSREALYLSKMFNKLRDVSRIEKHMRIQTGEKPFFCKECS